MVGVVKIFCIFGYKSTNMALEQITTDMEVEEQPAPKGMVRTEMGKLVTKAKSAADQKAYVDAMQAEYKDRMKRKAMALKSMMKKK
jgi:hypothetical protein